MRLRTALVLGRVSNLPTVWTNALAGAVLASAAAGTVPGAAPVALAALALSLFYVGGMWLNDAYDAEIDAAERAARPIPRGEARRETVFAVGFALLGGGAALSVALGTATGVAGLLLAGTIILYDRTHKQTALAPLVMGATRVLAWALGALAVAPFAGAAVWGALGLGAYVVGLTCAARAEAYDRVDRAWPLAVLAAPVIHAGGAAIATPQALPLFATFLGVLAYALVHLLRRAPGDVGRAVSALIAGIALYDAVLMAAAGAMGLATLAALAFLLTLALQRVVPGT